MRRRVPPRWWGAIAIGLVALLGAALFVAGGRDGDGSDAEGAAAHGATTTIATGGIEIDAPDGWQAIPVASLGFGLALPDDWEAVVLSGDGLARIAEAAPKVPGFVNAAHAAASAGSVFYAAGVDGHDHVTDLKVRVARQSGVKDAASLEDYARHLATDAGLEQPAVTPVGSLAWPAVDVRYTAPPRSGSKSPTEGTERSVLAPSGAVYSFLVTSEGPAQHDRMARRLFGTLAFPSPS